MATIQGESKIEKLQSHIRNSVKSFSNETEKAEQALFDRLELAVLKLETSNGKIKRTVSNLRYINTLKNEIDRELRSGIYSESFRKFLVNFRKVPLLANDYFDTILSGANLQKKIFTEYLNTSINIVTDNLINNGVNTVFRNGVTDVIKQNVTSGATVKSLRQDLYRYITADKRLTRYVSQVSDDAINQYSRAHMKAVTEDQGLKHYFYKGTVKKTSRDFCESRTGKYFTDKEIRSWAKLEWPGKISGTNEETIFTNLGGYRCRHMLIPITKDLYDKKTGT